MRLGTPPSRRCRSPSARGRASTRSTRGIRNTLVENDVSQPICLWKTGASDPSISLTANANTAGYDIRHYASQTVGDVGSFNDLIESARRHDWFASVEDSSSRSVQQRSTHGGNNNLRRCRYCGNIGLTIKECWKKKLTEQGAPQCTKASKAEVNLHLLRT